MEDRYRFTCAHCDVEFLVDGAMRATMLDEGCPACGDDVREPMFARAAAGATEE